MKLLRSLSLLVPFCAIQGFCADECSLSITVLRANGSPVPHTVRSFKSTHDPERQLASQFQEMTINSVPCGSYSYDLEPVGTSFRRKEGVVVLQHPRQRLTLVAESIMESAGQDWDEHVDGLVKGADFRAGNAWLRIMGLAPSPIHEVEIEKDGKFTLSKLPSGVYLLLVLQSDKLLGSARFENISAARTMPSSISVDLEQSRVTVLKFRPILSNLVY